MKKIFVHIPKNGGTSIRRPKSGIHNLIINSHKTTAVPLVFTQAQLNLLTLSNNHTGYQHLRWRDFKSKIRQNNQAFAIVRNPWSRTVSRYTFSMKHRDVLLPKRPADYTFEEFLDERYIWNGIPYLWLRASRSWYQQLEYVVDDNKTLKCDILRFEHFNEDVSKYFNHKNIIPVVNTSDNKKDYREYYTNETKQIIEEWYSEDIDFFGFTFDGTATKNIWSQS